MHKKGMLCDRLSGTFMIRMIRKPGILNLI